MMKITVKTMARMLLLLDDDDLAVFIFFNASIPLSSHASTWQVKIYPCSIYDPVRPMADLAEVVEVSQRFLFDGSYYVSPLLESCSSLSSHCHRLIFT